MRWRCIRHKAIPAAISLQNAVLGVHLVVLCLIMVSSGEQGETKIPVGLVEATQLQEDVASYPVGHAGQLPEAEIGFTFSQSLVGKATGHLRLAGLAACNLDGGDDQGAFYFIGLIGSALGGQAGHVQGFLRIHQVGLPRPFGGTEQVGILLLSGEPDTVDPVAPGVGVGIQLGPVAWDALLLCQLGEGGVAMVFDGSDFGLEQTDRLVGTGQAESSLVALPQDALEGGEEFLLQRRHGEAVRYRAGLRAVRGGHGISRLGARSCRYREQRIERIVRGWPDAAGADKGNPL